MQHSSGVSLVQHVHHTASDTVQPWRDGTGGVEYGATVLRYTAHKLSVCECVRVCAVAMASSMQHTHVVLPLTSLTAAITVLFNCDHSACRALHLPLNRTFL